MTKRNGRAPNHTRTPSPHAAARAAVAAELEKRQADACCWEAIISMDPEDVSPQAKQWADDYWRRTYGPAQ